MKKFFIKIFIFISIIFFAGLFGKTNRSAKENSDTQNINEETQYNFEEMQTSGQADIQEECISAIEKQQEDLKNGSIREQYTEFEWNGFVYEINDITIYDTYDTYLESEHASEGARIQYTDGWKVDCFNNSMFVVVEIKVKNILDIQQRLYLTGLDIYILDENGVGGGKWCDTENGYRKWIEFYTYLEDVIYYSGKGLDKNDSHNATNPMLDALETVEITMLYSVSKGIDTYEQEIPVKLEFINPYNETQKYQFFLQIAGELTRSNDDKIDVYNDAFDVFVKCVPVIVE
ncbi:MAG: hypothetical protein E7259_10015 [Lachnospiraceae bacterium]|nr:hypothetical protein [Lachnospiraceae bacterium]